MESFLRSVEREIEYFVSLRDIWWFVDPYPLSFSTLIWVGVRGRCGALPYTSIDNFSTHNCSCLLKRYRFRCHHSVGSTTLQVFKLFIPCQGPFNMTLLLLWVQNLSWGVSLVLHETKLSFPGSWNQLLRSWWWLRFLFFQDLETKGHIPAHTDGT